MKIVVDGFGGDHAPAEVVKGVAKALRENEGFSIVLVGDPDVLLDELARELSGEEKKNEFIVLSTEYGEKSFRLCDVRAINIVDRHGNKTDILSYIQKALDKKE